MDNISVKAHTSFVGHTGYNAHSREFFTELSKFVSLKIRNYTVGSTWNGLTIDPHKNELYLSDYQRKLIGVQTLHCDPKTVGRFGSTSNSNLCDYTLDDSYYTFNENVDIVLNGANHEYYYNIEKYKGFKIAYNVWESTLYDDKFFNILKEYNHLWCPSNWQKDCIIKQGYPKDRVFVVPEAVDGETFKPNRFDSNMDLYKDNRFKFIMFGRWEYRKSTQDIIETFLKTFKKDDPVDLIISVDNNYPDDNFKSTSERLSHYNLNDDRIKIVHFPEREDYIKYLTNGHVFLSCSRSEGWNLPLCEAMACGTPSIYSNCSGQLEFTKDKGHPVKIIGEKKIPNGIGNYYEPDFEDLSKVMKDVYVNYWDYKYDALRESVEIRTKYTWKNVAKIAYRILRDERL